MLNWWGKELQHNEESIMRFCRGRVEELVSHLRRRRSIIIIAPKGTYRRMNLVCVQKASQRSDSGLDFLGFVRMERVLNRSRRFSAPTCCVWRACGCRGTTPWLRGRGRRCSIPWGSSELWGAPTAQTRTTWCFWWRWPSREQRGRLLAGKHAVKFWWFLLSRLNSFSFNKEFPPHYVPHGDTSNYRASQICCSCFAASF